MAVNGRRYSRDLLRDAIRGSASRPDRAARRERRRLRDAPARVFGRRAIPAPRARRDRGPTCSRRSPPPSFRQPPPPRDGGVRRSQGGLRRPHRSSRRRRLGLALLAASTFPASSGERPSARDLRGRLDRTRCIGTCPRSARRRPDDALFGLGYAHAQDRLWQMEFQRRDRKRAPRRDPGPEASSRRTAFSARSGFRRAAEAGWPALSPATRRALEAYAAGRQRVPRVHRGAARRVSPPARRARAVHAGRLPRLGQDDGLGSRRPTRATRSAAPA